MSQNGDGERHERKRVARDAHDERDAPRDAKVVRETPTSVSAERPAPAVARVVASGNVQTLPARAPVPNASASEKLLRACLEAQGLTTGLQVHEFNSFLLQDVPRVITDPRCAVDVADEAGNRFTVEFSNVFVGSGPRRSHVDASGVVRESRVRPLELLGGGEAATYSVPVTCDVTVTYAGQSKRLERQRIADLPVMLGSVACNTALEDTGRLAADEARRGSFVVGGHERVVVSQREFAFNKLVRTRGKVDDPFDEDAARVLRAPWTVSITSRNISPAIPKAALKPNTEPFESRSEFKLAYNPKSGDICVSHNSIAADRPVTVSLWLLALGRVWSPQEAERRVRQHPALAVTMHNWAMSGMCTQEQGVEYVAGCMPSATGAVREERVAVATSLLFTRALPHVKRGTPLEFVEYMLSELLKCVESEHMGASEAQKLADDVDHAAYERHQSVQAMACEQFRRGFWLMTRQMHQQISNAASSDAGVAAVQRLFDDAPRLVHHRTVTSCFVSWIKTGLLQVLKRTPMAGTVDRLDRKSIKATLSHLRRSTSQTSARAGTARLLHETQTGFHCPYETPDGDTVGLTRHAALCAVRSLRPPVWLSDWLADFFGSARVKPGATRVSLDGDRLPRLVDAKDALRKLRAAQVFGAIPRDTCFEVSRSSGDLNVRTDMGRLVQPLVRVGARLPPAWQPTWEWVTLEEMGCVEWFDAQRLWDSCEPEFVLAPSFEEAVPGEHTHAHLAPSAALGLVSATMPFVDMNQAPRNTYYCNMDKQAVASRIGDDRVVVVAKRNAGERAVAHTTKYDTNVDYTLDYPQAPVVCTATERITGLLETPNGASAIVAFLSMGENQEDSAIFCRESIDSGLLRITRRETVTITVNANTEVVTKVVDVGERVSGDAGSVLVGKHDADTLEDTSVRMRVTHLGVVESVRVEQVSTRRTARSLIYTIEIRRAHVPRVGDKFATRHGQKFTVSRICRRADMPWSLSTGTCPDVLLSPKSVLARMTLAIVEEMGAYKAAALRGKKTADATPFAHASSSKWGEELLHCNYAADGTEVFMNPFTGELMHTHTLKKPGIAVGPLQLHVLGHFASKWFARSVGPRDTLTHQPIHGKDKDGGLRFGEQERACLHARGCAALGLDRGLRCADAVTVTVCGQCRRVLWAHLPGRTLDAKSAKCAPCAEARIRAGVRIDDDGIAHEPPLPPHEQVTTKWAFLLLLQELWSMGISVRL